MNHITYNQYKDSNIYWIGNIPSHWHSIPVKHHFISKKQVAGELANDYERLALTLNGVIKRSKDDSEGLQPEKFETYQIVRKDSLIFKLIDLENIKTSRVGLSKWDGLVSPAYIILSANGDILPSYAEKYFLNMWYEHIFNQLGSVGVRSNLNKEDVLNLPIIKPPLEEQKQIANFLDKQTAKIDETIAKNLQLIELLEEKRISLINQVVTKGLNPDVPVKDSGIEWIGEIPEHWDFIPVDKFSSLITDYVANGSFASLKSNVEYLDEENYAILVRLVDNTNDFKGKFVYINEDSYNFLSKTKLKEGDIILANIGATLGTIFKVPDLGKPMSLGPNVLLIRFENSINGDYFLNLINSRIGKCFIDSITTQTTQPKFNKTELRRLRILHPPINEQKLINHKINDINQSIDNPIDKIKKQINFLEEYKPSLIYHVVTGKIDVRGEEI